MKTLLYSFVVVFLLSGLALTDNFGQEEHISGISISAFQYNENILAKGDVYRVGAKCCDGTNSKATGRGACSHHGGVKYWKMSDKTTVSTGRCD
jgi:hypothetical protein